MNILLHICCGPCTAYPLQVLRGEGHAVQGWFHNPNIHPYQEFRRRLEALEVFSAARNLPVDYDREYGLREFLRQVVFHEEARCLSCYEMRLRAVARRAKETGADAFTSTLLYSRYQNHSALKSLGERLAVEYGVPFYYQDFREGWQEGIEMSVEMGLYRQPYCGCIYSEEERYDPTRRRKKKEADHSQQ